MKAMIKSVVTVFFFSAVLFGAVKMVHSIDAESCTSCGLCEETCPVGAISLGEVDGVESYVIDPTLCDNCGDCAGSCPVEAIAETEVEIAVKTAE